MQHKQMVCRELHNLNDLVLDQNLNDNTYSTPVPHEAFDVDHKLLIIGIGYYHNSFSLICVQRKPQNDNHKNWFLSQ